MHLDLFLGNRDTYHAPLRLSLDGGVTFAEYSVTPIDAHRELRLGGARRVLQRPGVLVRRLPGDEGFRILVRAAIVTSRNPDVFTVVCTLDVVLSSTGEMIRPGASREADSGRVVLHPGKDSASVYDRVVAAISATYPPLEEEEEETAGEEKSVPASEPKRMRRGGDA